MVLVSVPVHFLKSHGGVIDIQHLKLSIFVSSIKDIGTAVLPAKSIIHRILWAYIHLAIVPAAVLQKHGFYLPRRV